MFYNLSFIEETLIISCPYQGNPHSKPAFFELSGLQEAWLCMILVKVAGKPTQIMEHIVRRQVVPYC